MGLIFVVVGFITGTYSIVGLGVVVGLVGFFSRQPSPGLPSRHTAQPPDRRNRPGDF